MDGTPTPPHHGVAAPARTLVVVEDFADVEAYLDRCEYHRYFSGAKRASTRRSRVEKYVDKILDGRGFRDRSAS